VFFLLHPSSIWFKDTTWVACGATARQQGLSCGDVTSGLPNDVIIDVDLSGHGQMVTSGLPNDVMGRDVTSG